MIGAKETRRRKFDPQKFFLSILYLVGSKNNEGYLHALFKTWDLFSDLKDMPVKSALTKVRKRIHFDFFKSCFDQVIAEYEPLRRTWRGLRVYATDGDQQELPRSKDVLSAGYRGFGFTKGKETHYPRMYTVHCYDVLGGVTKDFRYSECNDEILLATEIATALEKSSLVLYDRLFLCKDLIRSHQASNSFFIARCKEGQTFTQIKDFFKCSERNARFLMEGTLIELIKVINPRSGEAIVYATNLPRSRFRNKEIADLYALRWEVETANRDLTSTLKMEQWHSQFQNGILQELYAALWLTNQTRIQMVKNMRKCCSLQSLFDYEKPNFKLISDFILDSLEDLVQKKITRVQRRLKELIKRSKERRKRRSRSSPRHIRRALPQYPKAPSPKRLPK